MIKILTIFFIIINTAFPQIIEAGSLEHISFLLSDGTISETLAIFNCYNVLLFKPDSVFRFDIETGIKNRLRKSNSRITEENERKIDCEYKRLFRIIWESTKPQLVDPNLPKLISDFQKHEGRVLVLADLVGKCLGIKWAIDTTLKELNAFGLDFSNSWKGIVKPDVDFAYFKNGIIPSFFINKTWSLDLFLRIVRYKPKRIVFVDCDYGNLKYVKNIFNWRGLNFCGIYYDKVLRLLKQINPSKEVVKHQLLHLLLFDFWIPESVIRAFKP